MKILVVSQYFWPEEFRINDLAQELVDRGHEVTALTGWPNYPNGFIFKDFLKDSTKFDTYLGVKIIRVPLIARGDNRIKLLLNYCSFTLMSCLLGPWRLRGRDFDIVLTNQLSPVTVGLSGALIAWLKSAPMAMWVLDLWPDSLRALGIIKSARALSWMEILVAFIYRRCDLILAQSKSFVPKIQKIAGKEIRVIYFPSWAEDTFKVESAKPASEVLLDKSKFNVMFAGNIGEAQDFECILSAASLIKSQTNIRWLIVGHGRMSSWVSREIVSRGLDCSVFMLGRHPVIRMPEFFAHADVMLVTLANQEIFSMTIPAKLQSYLAAGMPIVGALNGEGAEIIRNAKAGFTCPAGDDLGLATLILKISNMSVDERRLMGKNGIKFSQMEFDRQKTINNLESFLLGLIN